MRTSFLKLKRQIPIFVIANVYSIPKALLSGMDISSNISTTPVSSFNRSDVRWSDEDKLYQNPSSSNEGFLALTPPLSSSDSSSPKKESEYKDKRDEDLLKSLDLTSNLMDGVSFFSILSLLQNTSTENNINNVDNINFDKTTGFTKELNEVVVSNNDFNNINQQYHISLLQPILTNLTSNYQYKNFNTLSSLMTSNNININNISYCNESLENNLAKILHLQNGSTTENNTISNYLLSSKKIDDKPFKCDFESCLKTFSNKHLLKKHQFTHTGIRPHSCTYCGKKFSRKDNCLRHERSHGNESSKFL
ncbi:Zinc finger, C2H2 domain and Zinc finger C2H2-type/integrase DNA-binding domain and Zinc finger, C2H2-like domain-containing protein [Strongyloides ratti]|uniref:Zinc finger, C2H2 domain and Zinc finger C2H2-type/integrase DNA-binding domain and Zinc finger, C2H2-like domain-containing protein n=1 Tax=Strongyloides ratti TaxID=34506 RepID=A0A090LN66_STRRB|nr:Zinc finger, C2H2 domain and Zinc finger C2H2-type/integrase DNA-binding domain and Zinc finger, C2H2-like domain-containing protein [Strongyloides ratti]CEF68970.1 Zinc finger, C2H2 domain and Zinc finger C2H2-type/integrase DNA-binding domain and Zinc finger, C2H2-like domain-containing protein [Strongyloides ratti]